MSVTQQTPYNQYTGNGSSTVYPYQFLILQATDLAVYVAGVLKTSGADYSVAGAGTVSGGTVTFVTAPASGVTVTLVRAMRQERLTDYQQAGDFLTSVVNPDFDRAILLAQDLLGDVGRAIRAPPYEVTASMQLPAASARANLLLAFDANGNAYTTSATALGVTPAYGSWVADSYTGNGATTVFTLSQNAAVAANVDVSLDGATLLPGTDYTLTGGVTLTLTNAPLTGQKLLARYGIAFAAALNTSAPYYDLNDAENQAGGAAVVVDRGKIWGNWKRYGLVGNNPQVNDTIALANMLKVGYYGQALDFGDNRVYLTSNVVLSAANKNIPPRISGNAVTFRPWTGTVGILWTTENPHAVYPGFSIDGNITFDGNYVCQPYQEHGSQNCYYGQFSFIRGSGGAQCEVKAEANFGDYYNIRLSWNAGLETIDGGDTHGFWVHVTDGSNRINGNLWLCPRSAWNQGHAYLLDRVADTFVAPGAELNDGDAWNVDNTTVLTVLGGYSEHNNENMSGGGVSDGTGDVTLTTTANSFRVMFIGGRHIGAFNTAAIGLGSIILPGQSGGITLTQTGMGFGGVNAPSNGLNFPSSSNVNFQAGGTTFSRYDIADSTFTSVISHKFFRSNADKRVTVAYSASMTPDAALGNNWEITANNGVAFTINAPTNPADGMRVTVKIRNTSGGALGAVTWSAAFKMSAWTSPATGFSRSITFNYNAANWVQEFQATVDVPN